MLNSFLQRGRVLRLLLLCAALFQAFLPMAAQAAMRSADVSSPYYCGQMSPQLLQQLRKLDLPAELFAQVSPSQSMELCDACASTVFDTSPLPQLGLSTPLQRQADGYADGVSTNFFPRFSAAFSARAPPQ